MRSISLDTADVPWTPGSPIYGPQSIHEGDELVELKILSDRRAEGGGIAYIARFRPPPGKLIKIVAVARSDEHVYGLAGGRGGKDGKPRNGGGGGGYALNPTGKPHSAMIGVETTSLIVYSGEPDEIVSMEVVDIAAA
jgi:hypothetical protein